VRGFKIFSLPPKKRLDKNRHIVYTTIMTSKELKEWRERNGLSQAKLAGVLGVDVMTISRWERGIVGIPPFMHFTLYGIECMAKKGGDTVRKEVKGKKSKERGKA